MNKLFLYLFKNCLYLQRVFEHTDLIWLKRLLLPLRVGRCGEVPKNSAVEQRQLSWPITRRSEVRVLPAHPKQKSEEKDDSNFDKALSCGHSRTAPLFRWERIGADGAA